MIYSFEEWLKDSYEPDAVLDDDMPDAFDNWLGSLDGEEYIEYANEYGKYVAYETLSDIQDLLTTKTLKAHDELKK